VRREMKSFEEEEMAYMLGFIIAIFIGVPWLKA